MNANTNNMEASNNNFRSKVFKRAYQIMRNTGKAFAVCLSKAWAVFRLVKRMAIETVTFTYEKKDGTLRKAKGTYKGLPISTKSKGINFKSLVYFDVDLKAYRSFKIENLITVF